jgi:glycosyltransferase involved in cell wall biosynthesis
MELSVVIPCYRSARLVKRAIDSALAEGVSPGNIMVVEDGVFDDTVSVVSACQGVRLTSLDRNQGAPYARNLGLEHITTKYVMFLDADDYVENGLLRGLVDALEHEGTDVAIGPWRYDGEGLRRDQTRLPTKLSNAEWIIAWTRLRFFPPCSVVWNADSIRRLGGWDERLKKNQDGELMIRAFLKGAKVSISSCGNGVYWQHASPHRVTSAKVDDLLHATGLIFEQLEKWVSTQAEIDFPIHYRNELGRYCCVTAWHAFAYDRIESGRYWMAKARAYGFDARGYNYKTRFLAGCLGMRLSSKVRVRLEHSRAILQRKVPRAQVRADLEAVAIP